MVKLTNKDDDDLCVDMVEIGGRSARSISNNWIGDGDESETMWLAAVCVFVPCMHHTNN